MFPTRCRAKSKVFWCLALWHLALWPHSIPLPPAHTILDEVQHVPCPLCLDVLSSLPHNIRLAPSYSSFKTRLQCPFLCETSLTHLAEYALPFASHCSDTISLLDYEFLEGSLSLYLYHQQNAWYIASRQQTRDELNWNVVLGTQWLIRSTGVRVRRPGVSTLPAPLGDL